MLGFASSAIFRLMVSGTAKNIPPMPNKNPQKSRLKSTTSVLIPRLLPRNFGSIKLPMTIFTARYSAAVQAQEAASFSKSATKSAGTAAIIEPIVGIKFSTKAKIPQSGAEGRPIKT